jgi:septum formation protein
MRKHGYDIEVIAPPLEEPAELGEDLPPEQLAEALSNFKAQAVAAVVREGLILAGDTVVSLGRRVFGKPLDRDHARAILSALAGTTHHVITGITLLEAASGKRLIRHERTTVTMKPMFAVEIGAYLDTGAWEGKAGAYGIQDCGDAFVERVEGSFTNVVGLPMELVAEMLGEFGIKRRDNANTSRQQ